MRLEAKDMPSELAKEFKRIRKALVTSRWQFEMSVECAALEVIEIAKQISAAIGEVSYEEAQNAIIREFTERLRK